jgi:hypothetical protein
MEKIIIELIETLSSETGFSGWKVSHGDKYADAIGYDEMLGLVAAITMPENRPTLNWLRTADEHKARREYFDKIANDVEYEPEGA